MKYSFIPFLCFFYFSIPLIAQVGIGTISPNSQLDIRSTSQVSPANTDGILIPKINNFPLTNPTVAQDGMMVYATGIGIGAPFKGFYYWDNATSNWISVTGAKQIDDLSDAKSDNLGSSLFLGRNAGFSNVGSNNKNLGVGINSLTKINNGTNNTAVGFNALSNSISNNSNTAIGSQSLFANVGDYNTATGSLTLRANTTGSYNTANGFQALNKNTTAINNTAIGAFALNENTTGKDNTAIGYQSLFKNTIGVNNTASGWSSLNENTQGNFNTADGYETLKNNSSGNSNTAIGARSLLSNTLGNYNTANGAFALNANTEGIKNTANGFQALFTNTDGESNTASGANALFNNVTGDYNTAFGEEAMSNLTAGNNNIAIGYNAQVPNSAGSNQIRIGDANITLAEVQIPWTSPSDKRWKNNIRTLPYGLNMVSQLKPVDYIRKNNDSKTREIGFIAQDVEVLLGKLGYTDQGLLNTDDNGYLSLRYNDFIPVLVKSIQEQQVLIESLQKEKEEYHQRFSETDKKNKEFGKRLEKLEALLIPGAVVKD